MQFFEIKTKHYFKRKKLKPNKNLILDVYNGAQAGEYLGITRNQMWRMRNVCGGGPVYFTKGVRELYTKDALDTWAEENLK